MDLHLIISHEPRKRYTEPRKEGHCYQNSLCQTLSYDSIVFAVHGPYEIHENVAVKDQVTDHITSALLKANEPGQKRSLRLIATDIAHHMQEFLSSVDSKQGTDIQEQL